MRLNLEPSAVDAMEMLENCPFCGCEAVPSYEKHGIVVTHCINKKCTASRFVFPVATWQSRVLSISSLLYFVEPCPFCGEEPRELKQIEGGVKGYPIDTYFTGCSNKDCVVSMYLFPFDECQHGKG